MTTKDIQRLASQLGISADDRDKALTSVAAGTLKTAVAAHCPHRRTALVAQANQRADVADAMVDRNAQSKFRAKLAMARVVQGASAQDLAAIQSAATALKAPTPDITPSVGETPTPAGPSADRATVNAVR